MSYGGCYARALVALISLSSSAAKMEADEADKAFPPLEPAGEQVVVQRGVEYETCLEVLKGTFEDGRARIGGISFTFSIEWGYVLRAKVNDLDAAGQEIATSRFMCWMRPGELAEFYISYE